ncbi:MAG: hypothetical protein GY822_10895 [Deltaproteobacteria bacterium]|nr:hypothetical protein [Deltaproteobacteria bacterium]
MSFVRGGNPTQVVDVSSDDLQTYAANLRGMVWDDTRQVLWLEGEGVVHRLAFPEPLLTLQTYEIFTVPGDAQPAVLTLHDDELHFFYDAEDGDRWVTANVASGTPIFADPLHWGDDDSSNHRVRAAQFVCDSQLLLTVQGSRQALRIYDLDTKTLTQNVPTLDGFAAAKSMMVSTSEELGLAGDLP